MNAVAILVAIFLMWLILKECVGIRAANKGTDFVYFQSDLLLFGVLDLFAYIQSAGYDGNRVCSD